jgi:transketolase
VYLRTTREETPIIYRNDEVFRIGGSKVLKRNSQDVATVVAAGITLHEALAAYEELKKDDILIGVIDLYSIKPIDVQTLTRAALNTGMILTVEDHFAEGGMGEAVRSALTGVPVAIYSLAVRNMPKSGQTRELLDYEEISRKAIIEK